MCRYVDDGSDDEDDSGRGCGPFEPTSSDVTMARCLVTLSSGDLLTMLLETLGSSDLSASSCVSVASLLQVGVVHLQTMMSFPRPHRACGCFD